jgi:hypothetical protein
MALDRAPRYVRPAKLAGGKKGYYWELPSWARPKADKKTGKIVRAVRHGRELLLQSEPLGSNQASAYTKAESLNAALDAWRKGEGEGAAKVIPGTVDWLFAWYRQQDRFTSKKHKTRSDYAKLMNMLGALPTKNGPKLGRRKATAVDATVADKLYERLRTEKGERQASYAMQVCRLVWTWAVRHTETTGIIKNPFAGMGLKSVAEKGNRETGRAEYDLYRETARALGYQSMATAAALAFEGCQRSWDVFGFEDPEGVERRGIEIAGYIPGEVLTLIQSKTRNPVILPLFIEMPAEGGGVERVELYPELEEELSRTLATLRDGQEVFVVEERTGRKYKERRMSTVHREICVAAGLPKEMTFTGFRHGGITEIGDAGENDPRAVSGHKTLAVTRIYNKANAEKARRIAAARREHIARLGALDEARTK